MRDSSRLIVVFVTATVFMHVNTQSAVCEGVAVLAAVLQRAVNTLQHLLNGEVLFFFYPISMRVRGGTHDLFAQKCVGAESACWHIANAECQAHDKHCRARTRAVGGCRSRIVYSARRSPRQVS
jgi:hypothetical protein